MAERKKASEEEVDVLDVMLYAPIGFLYEYRKVLPQLVRKGRSQVQLGLFFGRMAAQRGSGGAEKAAAEALTTVASVAARGITEFGQVIGLAPPPDEAPPAHISDPVEVSEQPPAPRTPPPPTRTTPAPPSPSAMAVDPDEGSKPSKGADEPTVDVTEEPSPTSSRVRLPIAGYDDLTAREIIALLDDLTPAQRKRIRAHEEANRNRKTVLGKLDRLTDAS